MPNIFLSYSRDDQATARRFAEGFEREGFSVWWDAALHSGEAYDQVTEKALREAKAVVVLWSKTSVDSRWVRAEATTADRNKTLVPVMIEACNRPIMFELTHTADLSHWKGDTSDKAWKAYVADVHRFVGADKVPATTPPAGGGSMRTRKWALALGLAALLIAGAGWWMWGRSGGNILHTVAAKETTLAVLPFLNISSDPQQEYFSDGLTEEILNQLAQFKDLRVIGSISSFSFKGKNEDPRVVGEKLGATNLLEGSVQRSGNDLRVTAQLINSKDGTNLWSETYKKQMVNVFDVQEDIAKSVAAALRVALAPGHSGVAVGGTTNPEAYDAYLAAEALSRSADLHSSTRVVALLEKAVALDPQFADAWASLASAYSFVGDSADGSPAPYDKVELRRRASAALTRALAIAPNDLQALEASISFSMVNHDWLNAERQFRQALEQSPADYRAANGYGWFLLTVGRAKESSAYFERGKRIEPLSLQSAHMLVESYVIVDDTAKADAAIEQVKSFGDPSNTAGAEILRAFAKRDRTALQRLASDSSPLGDALRQGFSDPSVALAGLRRFYDDPVNRKGWFQMGVLASWAAYFGDDQLALKALQALSPSSEIFVIWRPELTRARQLAGFKDLVRDVKLVDYWRASGNWGDFCKPVGEDDFECH